MSNAGHEGEEGSVGKGKYRDDPAIVVSVPHRLDIGGTWDLPPLLYFGRRYKPKTLTIALNIVTTVVIDNGTCGYNVVQMSQVGQKPYEWSGGLDAHDYTGRLGLIQAVLAFFNIEGAKVDIDIGVPPQVGLGGSGALTVALVNACAEYAGEELNVTRTAHDIENGFFSMTGFQDQMAALAGGIRLWYWEYPPEKSIGQELLKPIDYHYLEDRIVIAIVGKHNSTKINQQQVQAFLTPANRQGWIDMNKGTAMAAKAIQNYDWKQLTKCIYDEHCFRNRIAPQRIADMELYIKATIGKNGVFATAGAGQAVCWYFSPDINDILSIKDKWRDLGARLLSSKIASSEIYDNEGNNAQRISERI